MSQRDVFSTGAGGGPTDNNGVLADSAAPGPSLGPADAAALDALIEAGWDAAAVGAEHRERARRLDAVFAMMNPAVAAQRDDALEDVVLVRVARARASGQHHLPAAASHRTPELSADDVRALDILVNASMDPAAMDLRDAQRARRHLGLLALLDTDTDTGSPADREGRIERTLQNVQRSIREQSGRMSLDTVSRRPRIQFADLVSVAALLLIASAVVWPILDGVRAYGQRINCQTGMQAAGIGFGQYAFSNREVLPMASASMAGTPWWDVGGAAERSNSANLFTLTRTGYTTLADLACAGNASACRTESEAGEQDWRRFSDVSYSYRMMFGRGSATLTDSPGGVVLSDRSTLVLVRPGVLRVSVFENSPNHGGRGQSVLIGDGSVRWMKSPLLKDGDNLWLPRSIEEAIRRLTGPADPGVMQGVETPGGLEDDFVAP